MFAQTTKEASLLIRDFPFFIYGSSWIYLALGLIPTHLLLFQLTASPRQIGMHKSRRVYMRPKTRELHELLLTYMTFKLASEFTSLEISSPGAPKVHPRFVRVTLG